MKCSPPEPGHHRQATVVTLGYNHALSQPHPHHEASPPNPSGGEHPVTAANRGNSPLGASCSCGGSESKKTSPSLSSDIPLQSGGHLYQDACKETGQDRNGFCKFRMNNKHSRKFELDCDSKITKEWIVLQVNIKSRILSSKRGKLYFSRQSLNSFPFLKY